MTELDEWREERNRALRDLDMDYARRVMPGASNDFVRLLAMHKGRYDCTDIEDGLRHESAEWLRSRGFKDRQGLPILPHGELPL